MKRAQRSIRTLAIITSLAVAAGFAAPRDALAFDSDAAWLLLGDATVEEKIDGDNWKAIKTFPDDLRAAARGFDVEGYVIPVEVQARFSRFLLVQDPANCPFCGAGDGYGPVLEVEMRRPIPEVPEFSRLRVKGTLEFNEDPETFQMFTLVDAVVVDAAS